MLYKLKVKKCSNFLFSFFQMFKLLFSISIVLRWLGAMLGNVPLNATMRELELTRAAGEAVLSAR
jgi:hypothetical protein